MAVDELGGDDLVEREAGLVARLQEGERLVAGLEKTRFLKKPSPVVFFGFFWFFFGFFGVFGVFLGFSGFFGVFWFFNIFAQKREFLGFFQFQEYF